MTTGRTIRVGLIGHRDITDPHAEDRIRKEARSYFSKWKAEGENIEILTQLAVGADTILTKTALEYGAKLVLVIPYEGFKEDFSAHELQEYQTLSRHAQHAERLPFRERSDQAYEAAGHWIADHADFVLAVWDGEPAHGDGGTASILTYAQQHGKKTHVIQAPRTQSRSQMEVGNSMLEIRYNEYAAIFENTAKLSDRRQTVNDLFVGINSLILTALGLLFVTSHLKTWWTASAFAVVTLFTFGANVIWLKLINRYKNLINLRISYMEGLENAIHQLGRFDEISVPVQIGEEKQVIQATFGIHSLEAKTALYSNAPKVGFTQIERNLIYYFMLIYVGFTAIVALLTYLISIGSLSAISF
jgi:hypothetical protein